MESKEFISKALKTEYSPEALPITAEDLKNALNMAIACANIMDQIKKLIIYGKDIDVVKLSFAQEDLVNYSEDFVNAMIESQDITMSVPVTNSDINIRLLHAAIGVFTESGEMLEALLGQLETGTLDRVNFGEELGDTRWYEAIAIDELKIPEMQILITVIKKLEKRYPEKFTQEAALTRDLFEERKVLEEGIL